MVGRATLGPLISQPDNWLLIFERQAPSRFFDFVAFGKYKHVKACGYVPFLHVWTFFDPSWSGTELYVAEDGRPALYLMSQWIVEADVMRFPRKHAPARLPPLAGWCVPQIKRLIGLRSGALRPDTLWRDCLANGGVPLEANHGSILIH
jgi:hypothetical protein